VIEYRPVRGCEVSTGDNVSIPDSESFYSSIESASDGAPETAAIIRDNNLELTISVQTSLEPSIARIHTVAAFVVY